MNRIVGALAKRSIGTSDRVLREAVKYDTPYQYHQTLMNYVTRRFVPQFQSRVKQEDWKYLIVLDACRYDVFEQQCELDGDLEKANSCSGWTKEWAITNFSEGDWSDTVYVSASGWPGAVKKWIGNDPFHSVDEVWEYAENERTGGVHPRDVRLAATRNVQENPENRMVIHFQQPHTPLMGTEPLSRDELETSGSVYEAMRKGEVSEERVWESYVSNLDLVLEECAKLLLILDDKVVVTSDHGECFGEYNLFEHPGPLVPEIIEVPWLTIEKTRDVELADIEVPDRSDREPADDVEKHREEHLKKLGYL